MENRTVDNLFQGYPNADTQSWGYTSTGLPVTLTQEPIDTSWDPIHSHEPQGTAGGGFTVENNGFANNGWDLETFDNCSNLPCTGETALAYVQASDVAQYTSLANQFELSAEVRQTNMGPSFPAHQYLIAGQANGYSAFPNLDAAELPTGASQCTSKKPVADVLTVNLSLGYPGLEPASNEIAPCQDYETIYDLMDTAAGGGYPQINWKSYVPATTIPFWNAPMSIKHLFNLYGQEGGDAGTGNFVVDPGLANWASDVANHTLPTLSYIIPCPKWSDHAAATGKFGPSFVAYIANGIGLSKFYWTTEPTAVIVVWDDWGGWFDHETPFQYPNPLGNSNDPNNYGYRVPMLVISPYTPNDVDSKQKTQASILSFIEAAFGLGTLGNTDNPSYSGDNLINNLQVFNFAASPRTYTRVGLRAGAPTFGSSATTCPNADFDE